MKKLYTFLLCAAGVSLVSADVCYAQMAPLSALPLKSPAGAVTIDGSNQEWGDTLSYYNAEKKVRYTLANDKDKLYLVIKTKDPVEESNIMLAGVTFTVDPKGKKRSSFTTTFPSNGDGPASIITKAGEEPLPQKAMRAKYTKFKKIAVSGFKDISDDYITPANTYGIEVAMAYDDQGNLVYEEAIPLALFHAGDLIKGEWSFNIKLNGLEKSTAGAPPVEAAGGSGGGGGRGGRGGGGHKSAPDPSASAALQKGGDVTPTIDFWGRFSLAKAQ